MCRRLEYTFVLSRNRCFDHNNDLSCQIQRALATFMFSYLLLFTLKLAMQERDKSVTGWWQPFSR
ncbi:hypothetical protein WN48_10037 [Eufriesea mexicana]|nr:hypothetical protein WN48_10037 [Eufriesea mexicana]